MRKEIMHQNTSSLQPAHENYLDLTQIARVKMSSEDENFSIEHALTANDHEGWRASKPGKQTIRILFDDPQQINTIDLVFEEKLQFRTQEFSLGWFDGRNQYQEIIRQQYNFSPGTNEQERYYVNLKDVNILELKINPDISNNNVLASLKQIWIS